MDYSNQSNPSFLYRSKRVQLPQWENMTTISNFFPPPCCTSYHLFFITADAPGGPAVFVLGSTLGGVFIGLLVLLLIFLLYLRQRRNTGFEPLIKADFTNRKYTEEA